MTQIKEIQRFPCLMPGEGYKHEDVWCYEQFKCSIDINFLNKTLIRGNAISHNHYVQIIRI